MIRIVLDTNILVSGLAFGGKPAEIMRLVRHRQVEFFISPFILKEMTRVLADKFKWQTKEIKDAVRVVQEYAHIIDPKNPVNVIKKNITDNNILACGEEARADYIITGDKVHLLSIKEYKGITIIEPAQFLNRWYKGQL